MERIALIGSGGSGKSTLARKLGEKLDIEVFHLDALFWKIGWEGVPKEQQREIQAGLVEKERWIIDGNYGGTLDLRLDAADTVIFLDMPRLLCMWQIFKRRLKYHGRTRPDMGYGCDERLDPEFVKWVWDFPKTKKPGIQGRLARLPDRKEVIILRSRAEVELFLESLQIVNQE